MQNSLKAAGLATAANLIGVKIFNGPGTAQESNVLAGFEWIVNTAVESMKPSVVCLGFNVPTTKTLNDAAFIFVDVGIHVAGGAGEEGANANWMFPGKGE